MKAAHKSRASVVFYQGHFLAGQTTENYKKIKAVAKKAMKEAYSGLVFPAFALTGTRLQEEYQQKDFLSRCQKHIDKLKERFPDLDLFIDYPILVDDEIRQRVVHLYGGEIQAYRDNPECLALSRRGKSALSTISYVGKGLSDSFTTASGAVLSYIFPSELSSLRKASGDALIVADHWPFAVDQYRQREAQMSALARQLHLPVYLFNGVGGQASFLYAGGSRCWDRDGNCKAQAPYFKEQFFDPSDPQPLPMEEIRDIDFIHQALVMGLRDYFVDRGFKKAILGLSGGIDSAVVLPLAVEALGRKNVLGLLMPSAFSSDHSIADAQQSADNLGVDYRILPIEKAFESLQESLSPLLDQTPFGLAEENLQARTRGAFLMTVANKFGYILLNTSNKTEAAVGYGTLYGDLCGALSVIGDLYKEQVYALADELNKKRIIVPHHSIRKAPSAELRPGQKDSDSLPEYPLLDAILKGYLDQGCSPQELARDFGTDFVERCLRLLHNNEFKRRQCPPQLRISSSALGIDRKFVM